MKAKILIIDDHPEILNMYSDVLIAQNYDVRTAQDGLEGVKLATEYQPDVILLDIMMPKMDGFAVLTSLRNGGKMCCNIIVLSNLDNDADKKHALDAGATMFLSKSDYTPDQIIGKIEEIIAAKK